MKKEFLKERDKIVSDCFNSFKEKVEYDLKITLSPEECKIIKNVGIEMANDIIAVCEKISKKESNYVKAQIMIQTEIAKISNNSKYLDKIKQEILALH